MIPRTALAAITIFTAAALGIAALDLWTKEVIFEFLEVESARRDPSDPDSPPYVRSQVMVPPEKIGERKIPREEFGYVIVKDLFWLQANYNYGAFKGMFSEHTGALALVSAIAVIVLIAVLIYHLRSKARQRPDLLFVLSLGLLLGGTLGNLYDRAALHAVRDWILWFVVIDGVEYRWPNFNVADSSICTGVALLIVLEVVRWRREAKAAKAARAEDG